MKYEFLEHTADVKFRAYGKTLEKAFENAAIATFQVMTDVNKIEKKHDKDIKVKGDTAQTLLYNFLEELIFLMDSESFLLADVKLEEFGHGFLKAKLIGDYQEEFKYDVHTYIKAVTYNELLVDETEKGYMVQVVHDI